MADELERWCLVTGGRGFAARHLVDMLIRYDMYPVRIADKGPYIKLEPHEEKGVLGQALHSGRAQYVSMDLRNKSQVFKACHGVEVVYHMAAPDSSINNHQLHYSINVHGTKNIIDACSVQNVKRLIYTSSPSVVFDGKHGIFEGVESMPYPAKHIDSYSSTKAEAEALIIKANGMNGLLTCCIRPSSIFGPGDKLLVPSLVAAARKGRCKYIIGNGKNMYDFTYVENVAHAHVCAERALASGGTVSKRAAGEAYFITNMEPIRFWEFMSLFLEGLGYKRPKTKVPVFIMMLLAFLIQRMYRVLAPYGMRVPQLTSSRIRLLSCNRTFSSFKANDRLGYRPLVPLQEALKRTIESYSDLKAEVYLKNKGASKAAACLGNGIVADIFLWRDIKLTLGIQLILCAFYVNLVSPGNTMITAISKLFIMGSVFLFIQGKLPDKLLGCSVEKISEVRFADTMARQTALSLVLSWNCAARSLKSISSGSNSILFVKTASFLSILALIGSMSMQSFFTKVLPFSFIAFYIYEQMEDEIDGFLQRVLPIGRSNPNLESSDPYPDKKHE
ncbi:3beta-hydroxysteroid-dehydrogenase/decarboxylase-like, partial [Bidens hawaiensis]|uniref:3beta-hydroxysteroid- dehydrogenase/decarboxylase-like n=1 Tax=Bidens hawaiensis TaxID=980011 RepID=UPI00404B5DE2